eukprot:6149626-Pyramimonas_sp.AAC.1
MHGTSPRPHPPLRSRSSARPAQGAQVLSVAGPDATKIGSDFAVMMAVMLEPKSKLACICLPQ